MRITPPLHTNTTRITNTTNASVTGGLENIFTFPDSPKHKPTWNPDILVKMISGNIESLPRRFFEKTRESLPRRAKLPPVIPPAKQLPKIRSLKKCKQASILEAKGLSADLLFRPKRNSPRAIHPKTQDLTTPRPHQLPRPTYHMYDEDSGMSNLSLRSRIRDAQVLDCKVNPRQKSQLRKEISPLSWNKTERKNESENTEKPEEMYAMNASLFRPISVLPTTGNEWSRPRSISLTGIEHCSEEFVTANQGQVLSQLRIMRAKLKSREGSETEQLVKEMSELPCPGE
jgi:hypothetical protein